MTKQPQPRNVPPGFPIPSYNEPGHLEADFVDQIDISNKPYVRLATGTLYSAWLGADKKISDANPDLFLVHETMGIGTWPYNVRYWASQYVQTKGQNYDQEFDVPVPYTDTFAEQGDQIGDNRKDIDTINRQLARVRTVDTTAFDALMEEYVVSFPGVGRVSAPDVLDSLETTSQSEIGDGSTEENLLAGTVTGDHSFTIPSSASAQGSAAIALEYIPIYTPLYGHTRETLDFIFFVKGPVVTKAQVVAKLEALAGLGTVLWPTFNPKPATIVITSRRISLRVQASVTEHESQSDGGSAQVVIGGTGYSKEVGITVKTINIPPMIHGDLSFDPYTSVSGDIAVTAHAEIPAGFTQELSMTEHAAVSVIAFGLEATSGDTAFPNSGLLIVDVNSRPYKYGWVMFNAKTIDASTI